MRPVRIIPPEPYKENFPRAQGTKVQWGDGCSPEVWTDIEGVKSLDVHYRVDDIITATIEVFVQPDPVIAEARFVMQHPTTGEKKQISRIEFADGSAFEC